MLSTGVGEGPPDITAGIQILEAGRPEILPCAPFLDTGGPEDHAGQHIYFWQVSCRYTRQCVS